MINRAILASLLIYLISCTGSDNSAMQARMFIPKPVKTSIGTAQSESTKVEAFSALLQELARHQLIHTYETDLHQKVAGYLPDTLVSEGYDLHIREIGRIDTFRLVFHEYFDIYDDWSHTYLDIFSPAGVLLESMKLWDLSFEGITNIDFIDSKTIEIAYRDFFKQEDLRVKALVPAHNFYLNPSSKNKNILEGTIFQYYTISPGGKLKNLSQNIQVSEGRKFPQSSAKLLSKSELSHYSLEELRLMKNEIMAEYGFIFQDEAIQYYFEQQDWYLPGTKQIDSLLTDIERLNINLLVEAEREF